MKNIRFNISLYIIIPLIFAGIALLSFMISYRITTHFLVRHLNPQPALVAWGMFIVLFSLVCGYLIVKFIIDPVKKFVLNTQELPVVKNTAPPQRRDGDNDDIAQFTSLFNQVTDLLSKVEARELFPDIVGQSRAMRGVFNQILKVASTDSTVLILGETGTGKELVANSIHQHSSRREKPFIAINCAAIPEGLLESELFGHEKGAFTGATGKKAGKIEAAHGGTIFLDEIGDMPLATQAKILRVLQENEIEHVGGLKPIKVDVRFIAATNKNLTKMAQEGSFRQDLFFRLNVFSVFLPPLKERREDIPLLAERFLYTKGEAHQISSEAMQLLMTYDWPGNVRELQNAMQSAKVVAKEIIAPAHLPSIIANIGGGRQRLRLGKSGSTNMDDRLIEIEKGMITEALARTGGVQIQAAKLLGIKERSLWHRLKKYQIDASQFKAAMEE